MKIILRKHHVLLAIALLSILGAAISIYDVIHPWGEQGSFCDFSSRVSCSVVNTCRYARLFGIKVAEFGVAGYLSLLAGTVYLLLLGHSPRVRCLMSIAAAAAVLFSLYLIGVQLFVIRAVCPTCLVSMASISLILLSCWYLYSGAERQALLAKAWTVWGRLIVIGFITGVPLATHGAYSLCFTIHPEAQQAASSLDLFAQCLTERGAVMYGTSWCGHCKNQKAAFGESFKYIHFVDCDESGDQCQDRGVKYYPTWMFADGTNVTGVASFDILSAKTGCTSAE